MGEKFDRLVEVSSQTSDRTWIKLDLRDAGIIPAMLEVDNGREMFRIGMICFRVFDVW